MIVTPGQLYHRAQFYHQLQQLTAAGLGLVHALEQLSRNPPASSYRKPVQIVLQRISEGFTFSESLRHVGKWLPEFDLTIIEAGEKSGRLDACFRMLAEHYTVRAQLVRQLLADLAYPVFLYHFAILIFTFVRFIQSANWIVFLLAGLLPVYAIVAFMIYAAQSDRGEKWRAWVESFLHPIPILGSGRRSMALARLAASLEALISAGVGIVDAWELSATASGSPALRRMVFGWRPQLDAGQTPAEAMSASSGFPEIFANQYATGEVSGKLDDTLRRLRVYYQDEGTRKLHAVAQWVPRLIYIAVLLIGGYMVIRFWMNYFNQINAVL
jgi:type IV pilus assembly protein PilC